METSRTNSEIKSACIWGGIGATFAAGSNYISQRNILQDTKVPNLESDVLSLSEAVKAPQKGVLDNVKNFRRKIDLSVEKDMLSTLKEGKYSGRAAGKRAFVGFADWAITSIIFDKIFDCFRSKKD